MIADKERHIQIKQLARLADERWASGQPLQFSEHKGRFLLWFDEYTPNNLVVLPIQERSGSPLKLSAEVERLVEVKEVIKGQETVKSRVDDKNISKTQPDASWSPKPASRVA